MTTDTSDFCAYFFLSHLSYISKYMSTIKASHQSLTGNISIFKMPFLSHVCKSLCTQIKWTKQNKTKNKFCLFASIVFCDWDAVQFSFGKSIFYTTPPKEYNLLSGTVYYNITAQLSALLFFYHTITVSNQKGWHLKQQKGKLLITI